MSPESLMLRLSYVVVCFAIAIYGLTVFGIAISISGIGRIWNRYRRNKTKIKIEVK